MTRSLVMAAIGVGMTVLVYGLVGIIVKLDDLGMMLMRQKALLCKVSDAVCFIYALVYARRALSARWRCSWLAAD